MKPFPRLYLYVALVCICAVLAQLTLNMIVPDSSELTRLTLVLVAAEGFLLICTR